MFLPYNPTLSLEACDKELSKLQKLNYNRFMWWRLYSYKTHPLPNKASFKDKILNGDFDHSCYKVQAQKCEHEMNDIFKECVPDQAKFIEKTTMMRARRKRLIEDYEKDERDRLDSIFKGFEKQFNITREELNEEIDGCLGKLIDLYYIIESKYQKYNNVSSGRGRPAKIKV
jgi:hypothetical protein